MPSETAATATRTYDVVVTRAFDAPAERVWQAWTDGELVKRWWGPDCFTAPVAKMDFREGGTSLVCMRSPDGHDMYSIWDYRQIVPLRRIEFVQNLADADGRKLDPATLGLPDLPQDVQTVVTFQTADGRTEMTVQEYGFLSEPMCGMARMGLEQCLNKMAASLPAA